MSDPKLYRCITCGRLLSDKIIKLGVCGGHKMRYATEGSLVEWVLLKLHIWERIALWSARREKEKYGY